MIKKTVESAVATAKKIADKGTNDPIKLPEVSVRKTSVADKCENDPQFLEQEERLDLLQRINKLLFSRVKNLSLLDLRLIENHTQKIFLSSEGSEIEQILIRASLFFGSSVKGSANRRNIRSVGYGGVGGIEQFSGDEFTLFLNDFITTLKGVPKAKTIKNQKLPVILNEEMGWNLCHEFCHAVESDLILNNQSPLDSRIGSKIGSEEVTIIDDASFKGFGEYYFDDEGVKASGTLIVDNGILYDFLQSRETAGALKVIPTSNGRAESSLYPPQVRQSNTFFESGNHSFEELLEEVQNGLFICDSFGGNADVTHGNFQLDAQFGRKIEKGKLTDYVTGFSLVGNLYTVLGNIIGLSNTLGSFPAFCGKNEQRVSVGAISPKVCLQKATIVGSSVEQPKINLSRIRVR
jgi:TldD protein